MKEKEICVALWEIDETLSTFLAGVYFFLISATVGVGLMLFNQGITLEMILGVSGSSSVVGMLLCFMSKGERKDRYIRGIK